LGVRFAVTPETLELYDPSGRPFLTSIELARRADAEQARAIEESARAAREAERAEREAERDRQADARANKEQARADRLTERLRALGIDPDVGPN
jgi:ribosomal protein L9